MTIGCHGMRHRPWRTLDGPALEEELVGAKQLLEADGRAPGHTGRVPVRLLRPPGAARRSVRSGYRYVYTSDRGAARRSDWVQARNTVRRDDDAGVARPGPRRTGLAGPPREADREAVALTMAIALPRSPTPTRRGSARSCNANLNPRVTADQWARAIHVPWTVDAPNAGFMLLDDDDEVVGAYLAFYSDADDRRRAASASATWARGACCEEHRFHSLRLLKALLAQDGYHFTDLSPSGNVVELNARLKFQLLDTTTVARAQPALAVAARARRRSAPTPR